MSRFFQQAQDDSSVHPGDFDVVLHSRVGLSRNLSAYLFAPRIDPEQKQILLSALRKKLVACGLTFYRILELSDARRALLIDRDFLPRAFAVDESSSLALSEDEPLWVLCLERDHVLVQAQKDGLALREAWNCVRETEERLGSDCVWAFDADFGFLTSDIQKIGTGLSASVSVHLPALELGGFIEKACKQALDAGFTIGGMYGSGGVSGGALYEIALPQGFMDAETVALDRLERATKLLVGYERSARNELLESGSWELFDFIGRAVGRALHAHSVSWDECAEIVSGIRLGLSIKVLAGMDDSRASALFYKVRNVPLSKDQNQRTPEHVTRAALLRNSVRGLHFSERYKDV